MTGDVLPFREVDNGLADALAERGVSFPLSGFAPGLYLQPCMMCGKRHMAAKSATVCLPCAIAVTVLVASRKEDDRETTYAAGRQSGLDDVRRFLAGGARSGSLVRTPTPAQREDVKRQARDADAERGEAPPRRYPDTEYLKETSRRARERIEAERRASGSDEPDPSGGDAA